MIINMFDCVYVREPETPDKFWYSNGVYVHGWLHYTELKLELKMVSEYQIMKGRKIFRNTFVYVLYCQSGE